MATSGSEYFLFFSPNNGEGATIAGTTLLQKPTAAADVAQGTWAVTAP